MIIDRQGKQAPQSSNIKIVRQRTETNMTGDLNIGTKFRLIADLSQEARIRGMNVSCKLERLAIEYNESRKLCLLWVNKRLLVYIFMKYYIMQTMNELTSQCRLTSQLSYPQSFKLGHNQHSSSSPLHGVM